MQSITRRLFAVLLAVVVTAGTAMAATSSEFYTTMLRRGIADFNAGRFESAAKELEIAAFGMLDAVEQFQTAQIYLAIAQDRLGHEAAARRAAQRVLAAERLQQRFATLQLPLDVRAGFATVTRKILTTEEQASLGLAGRPQSVPPPQTAASGPAAPSPPPASSVRPEPATGDASSSAPPSASTTPATTPGSSTPRTEPVTPPPAASNTTSITVPFDAPATPSTKETAPVVTTTNSAKPPAPTPQRPPSTAGRQSPPAAVTQERPAPVAQTPAPSAPSQKQKPGTSARLQEAERAIASNDLPAARAAFAEILTMPLLDRAVLMRVAEGTYRARDFRNTVSVFARLGDLRAGEEPYGFYLAVALYETGDYPGAKRALAKALPYIESTPLVERYRLKIEGAVR